MDETGKCKRTSKIEIEIAIINTLDFQGLQRAGSTKRSEGFERSGRPGYFHVGIYLINLRGKEVLVAAGKGQDDAYTVNTELGNMVEKAHGDML